MTVMVEIGLDTWPVCWMIPKTICSVAYATKAGTRGNTVLGACLTDLQPCAITTENQ